MAEKEYYDWDQALKPFHKRLVRIGEYIKAHNLIVDWLDIATEVAEADRLYREWRSLDDDDPWESIEDFDEEWKRRWWAYWVYVGEHLHGWWD